MRGKRWCVLTCWPIDVSPVLASGRYCLDGTAWAVKSAKVRRKHPQQQPPPTPAIATTRQWSPMLAVLKPSRQEARSPHLKIEGHLAGQVTLAVPRHHLLPHVVELDILDSPVVLVVLDRLVHLFVRLDSLLEVLPNRRGSKPPQKKIGGGRR